MLLFHYRLVKYKYQLVGCNSSLHQLIVTYFYMVAEMSGYKNPLVFSKEKPYDKYVEEICS